MGGRLRRGDEAVGPLLGTGLLFTALGGAVVGLAWNDSWPTVVAGFVLVAAGQCLVLLALLSPRHLLTLLADPDRPAAH